MTLTALRDRAPSLTVTGTTLAGLALVAPLEHAAGMALGLSDHHAWTVTLTVEGAAGAAIIAGHYVRAALALTGSSVLLGALWSADRAVRAEHQSDAVNHPALTLADDPARAGLAVGVVALVVAALALVHSTRSRITTVRADAAAAEREQVKQDAADAHARQLELDRVADDRAARQRADEARDAEAQRRHAAELARARTYDEQERARLALEGTRLRIEADRARVDAERAAAERARAEQARPPAAPRRAPNAHRTAPDDITARRARAEWDRAEAAGAPLTGAQLGALLGVTPGAARKIAIRWRDERGHRAADA